MTIRNLEYLFKPRSIAIVGRGKRAGGFDATVEFNLIEGGFKGPVMPVNPDQQAVSGWPTRMSIACRWCPSWLF